MKEEILQFASAGRSLPLKTIRVHTLVLGSGAAGLNAAVQLRKHGIEDVLIVTEGLDFGTSINTGSDKQTYYKLSLAGREGDSPRLMAEDLFAGGSMHGDLALVEACLSTRAFLHLVDLGVPFPQDAYGQFVGYKTDHDPRQRATSIGPYTSRDMCRALIAEIRRRQIPVHEGRLAVELLVVEENDRPRAAGLIALDRAGNYEAYLADNLIFATGGPGGLYAASVYPLVHTGGIGLALRAGATAQNLAEAQFGLASTKFRWNVSGTYMQVVPRFVSTAADGHSDAREFLSEFLPEPGRRDSLVFLKGYQWPFDARKAAGGSSLIDLLVYQETVQRGRRVFLDFRSNSAGFSAAVLDAEAREYLEKSRATQATPLLRLRHMNPGAIELYRDHGIDLETEMLEIAVCAQHNNGGLAANHWWESVNLRHLFPVGEVNGSHGAARPGGAALNSGQVGGFRAAAYIAAKYAESTLPTDKARAQALHAASTLHAWLETGARAARDWRAERRELQERLSRAAAHIRALPQLHEARAAAGKQWERLRVQGCAWSLPAEAGEAAHTQSLAFAQLAYLDAVISAVESGLGSRGSALVIDPAGQPLHPGLSAQWRYVPENPAFRDQVQETVVAGETITSRWRPRRPLPESDLWFENAWAAYRLGEIYA